MRMRPEDVESAMSRRVPNDVQCLHGTAIVPIPTPNGFVFAMRAVSHGDPGDQCETETTVPENEIKVTDYGMNEADLWALATAVTNALDMLAAMSGSES
jgi:hypothetical protein